MDFHPDSPSLQAVFEQARVHLHGRSKLLCFGDRLVVVGLSLMDVFREGLVGACSTASEALEHLQHQPVDLLLASEELEQGYGIELVRQARLLQSTCICMLFLRRESQAVVHEALDAGAQAVMFHSGIGHNGQGDFMQALATIASGGIYLPAEIRRAVAEQPADLQVRMALLDQLSPRELEVLQLLSGGLANREIAQRLFISQETVKSHVSTIISKLAVRDRTQAAVKAMRLGVVDSELQLVSQPLQ